MPQCFWKVLAAAGKPGWRTSHPIPLHCSGTITSANIAVSPGGTLTVALQTLEQPNTLQMIAVMGNPTVSNDQASSQAVRCSPMGKIDLSCGDVLLEALFEPQSAGKSANLSSC